MLRYFSLNKSLGQYVLLIYGMREVLFTFAIVYFVSIVGFGITFYGLFTFTDAYDTSFYTFLTMIQNTLGNFDFSAFNSNNYVINIIGIVLLVIFVIFTAIVLMNLLIAQMSNVYVEIQAHLQQEWGFRYAQLVSEYVLSKETNGWCVLPPPLNVISGVVWTVGLVYKAPIELFSSEVDKKHRSINMVESLSNLMYSLSLGCFLRLYHSIFFMLDLIIDQVKLLDLQSFSCKTIIGRLFLIIILFPMAAFCGMILDVIVLPWWIMIVEVYVYMNNHSNYEDYMENQTQYYDSYKKIIDDYDKLANKYINMKFTVMKVEEASYVYENNTYDKLEFEYRYIFDANDYTNILKSYIDFKSKHCKEYLFYMLNNDGDGKHHDIFDRFHYLSVSKNPLDDEPTNHEIKNTSNRREKWSLKSLVRQLFSRRKPLAKYVENLELFSKPLPADSLTDHDIDRIVRPIKPYIKSVQSEDLLRLECNMNEELKENFGKLENTQNQMKEKMNQGQIEMKDEINQIKIEMKDEIIQMKVTIDTLQSQINENHLEEKLRYDQLLQMMQELLNKSS